MTFKSVKSIWRIKRLGANKLRRVVLAKVSLFFGMTIAYHFERSEKSFSPFKKPDDC